MIRRLSGLGLAWAVLGGAWWFAAPAAAAEPVRIADGTLDWGLKASWRTYIGPSGTTLSEGATYNADGTFRLPIETGSFDPQTRTTDVSLAGRLVFSAHEDRLHMEVSQVRVVISPAEQLLYARVVSRDLVSEEIVDHGVIAVAQLDLGAAEPATAGGVTTWSSVPTQLTEEGAPRFIGYYPVGQVLDPVTLIYQGPGAKPEVETDTVPGTPHVEELAVASLGISGTDRLGTDDTTAIFHDPRNGLIHTVLRRGSAAVVASDAATLERVGTPSGRVRSQAQPEPAFDSRTSTVFALTSEPAGGAAALTASTWDPRVDGYDEQVVDVAPPSLTSALAWDPVDRRVVALARREAGPELTEAFVVTWRRGADGWARADFALPAPAVPGEWWTYGPIGTTGLGVASDGSLILARGTGGGTLGSDASSPTLRLLLADGQATVSELPGTTVQMPPAAGRAVLGYSQRVVTAADGSVVLIVSGGDTDRVLVLGPRDGTYAPLSESATYGVGQVRASTVDVSDGTVFTTDWQSGNLLVLRRGELILREPVAGIGGSNRGSVGGMVVTEPGVVVTTAMRGGEPVLLALRVAGASPGIDRQPGDTRITVPYGARSAALTLTAAASGDPAPRLQWQVRRGPGGSWRDVEGATAETLRTPVALSDDGSEYRLRATNAAGRIVSAAARLNVLAGPRPVERPSGAVPLPPPSAQPQPPARRAASIVPRRRAQRIDRKRRATLARLACPPGGDCRVMAPRRVRVRIAGRRHALAVLAPRTLGAGETAMVRVRLTKRAARRLSGRRATVRLRVTVDATTRTVEVAIRGRTRR